MLRAAHGFAVLVLFAKPHDLEFCEERLDLGSRVKGHVGSARPRVMRTEEVPCDRRHGLPKTCDPFRCVVDGEHGPAASQQLERLRAVATTEIDCDERAAVWRRLSE